MRNNIQTVYTIKHLIIRCKITPDTVMLRDHGKPPCKLYYLFRIIRFFLNFN